MVRTASMVLRVSTVGEAAGTAVGAVGNSETSGASAPSFLSCLFCCFAAKAPATEIFGALFFHSLHSGKLNEPPWC
jgi:hypothetical protein